MSSNRAEINAPGCRVIPLGDKNLPPVYYLKQKVVTKYEGGLVVKLLSQEKRYYLKQKVTKYEGVGSQVTEPGEKILFEAEGNKI